MSEDRLETGDRPSWTRGFVLAALAPALWGFAWMYTPCAFSGPTLCAFRIVTGIPCAGCGLTRSVCALTHGDWKTSLEMHAMTLPVLAYLAGVWFVWVSRSFGRNWNVDLTRSGGVLVAGLFGYHALRLACLLTDATLSEIAHRSFFSFGIK